MRNAYHDQLEAIDDVLVSMCRQVGASMRVATKALLEADLKLAEDLIASDASIDQMHGDIEQRAFEIVARQQPVASELRSLLAALRISASLERMGDLAAHVAKATRLRYPQSAIPSELHSVIRDMSEVASRIADQTAEVLSKHDVGAAKNLATIDDEMDQLHRELFNIMHSPAWTYGVETAIDVTLISRYYERYADHAVSIGKRVIHIVTGEPYY